MGDYTEDDAMDVDAEPIVPFEETEETEEAAAQTETDMTSYELFHEGHTGIPCLSFDILNDELGQNRTCQEPVSCSFVAGTQANQSHLNKIILLKMQNLRRVQEEDDADNEDESDEESDSENEDGGGGTKQVISSVGAKHMGCINRLRCTTINDCSFVASWSELGTVNIWDLNGMQRKLDNKPGRTIALADDIEPIFSYNSHQTEGFAIDWSSAVAGRWATGDCLGAIKLGKLEEGRWIVSNENFTSHTKSVEDIQWSPNEPSVFASCSVDKSIKIWDDRAKPSKACMLTCPNAHTSDVNVIHWNRNQPFIASGGDDGNIFIWDLKKFQTNTPVAKLSCHRKAVTTIEWHPTDASVLASGGEDDMIFQWDLACEKDTEEGGATENEDVPDQLLFAHAGQQTVKELHWHSQIPGLMISTAHSGFNIFKTISC